MSILVATDLSEQANAAIRSAAHRARRRGTSLTLLHCLELGVDDPSWRPDVPEQMRGDYRKGAARRLRETFEEVVPESARPQTVEYRVEFEEPGRSIPAVADEQGDELVIVAATGRNRVANFFLGSTAEEVVRRSRPPVLVVPADAETEPYTRIVAPVDFSDCSRASLAYASQLAREDQAELRIVHALPLPMVDAPVFPTSPPEGWTETFERQRRAAFDEFLADADLDDVDWIGAREMGSPADVIEDAVEEFDADLVVMGTHGRRGFERFFLGSTAAKILRRMPCPVVTLRDRSDEQTEP